MNVPITSLRGVGTWIAAQLKNLGIETVADMLLHLPTRYEDRTQLLSLGELQAGAPALFSGTLQNVEIKAGKKSSLLCLLNDGTGAVVLRFFHFNPAQIKQLQIGSVLHCFGEVRDGYYGLECVHPEYHILSDANPAPEIAQHLSPIYPTTGKVSQKLLRGLVQQALNCHPLPEKLPAFLLQQQQLMPLMQAINFLHQPPKNTPLGALGTGQHPAQRRLAFEELLAHHLSLRSLRHRVELAQAPILANSQHLIPQLLNNLAFTLTGAQQRVFQEIQQDLQLTRPMQRLLQGDVGSGKTIVAALSALQAIEAGYQVAIMSPTELLSEQHLQVFSHWLTPLGIKISGLSSSLRKTHRVKALEEIASGDCQIAIGTHSLFQETVNFAKLGLIIVDEQHRFGVHQRLALRNKGLQSGQSPHQLIMTATPIPRTLAMSVYADLDTSIIDELPKGRTPIQTVVIPSARRGEIIERIRHACLEGRQAYWVCTLIDESEVMQYEAAANTAEMLRETLPELRIGLVHGKLKSKDKAEQMQAFKERELDVLVATTVIEVGVDVPNASLMVIENAERLGLAQLHQLRGRVGRGAVNSFCVLLYQFPLSETAKSRLATLRETCDGFLIAQRDLELRGPGEMLGTRQTGVFTLKVADLQRDQALLHEVQQVAEHLLINYPENCEILIQRWLKRGLDYGEV